MSHKAEEKKHQGKEGKKHHGEMFSFQFVLFVKDKKELWIVIVYKRWHLQEIKKMGLWRARACLKMIIINDLLIVGAVKLKM